jgi:glycosyltransferase involved in cell wall biosynthesis
MDSLYISHTGMTEALGQSQVLPYLRGLSRRGYQIEILSFEPVGTTREAIDGLARELGDQGIAWQPHARSRSHHLAVKVWESSFAVMRGLATALRKRPKIVHARSYLPAAVADMITTVTPRSKMLFDCRGMLGEEYVEAGHWTRDRLEFRLLKAFERRAMRKTEGMVVLTEALRSWLLETKSVGPNTTLEVIPCCVDVNRFHPDPDARARVRSELGLGDRLTILYSGSVGAAWYLEDEMARLAGTIKRLRPDAAFLLLTPKKPDRFVASLGAQGFAPADLMVRPVAPAGMAAMLTAGDIALSLIQPCFSKMGSSPTKVAEYLASGIPTIVNAGVGDQALLASESRACVVLRSLDDAELERGAREAIAIASLPYPERAREAFRVANARFSTAECGVPRYARLYDALRASN